MDEKEKLRVTHALDEYAHVMVQQLTQVVGELLLKLKIHISDMEYHNINSEANSMEKVWLLVDSIRTRPHIFDAFCDALEAVKHTELANKLRCEFN